MDDIAAFITARLDETKAAAELIVEQSWVARGADVHVADRQDWTIAHTPHSEVATHIARHDPAAVLRDVEATRRILADVLPAIEEMEWRIESEWGVGTPREVVYEDSRRLLRLIASRWSDHPDYRPEWAVED